MPIIFLHLSFLLICSAYCLLCNELPSKCFIALVQNTISFSGNLLVSFTTTASADRNTPKWQKTESTRHPPSVGFTSVAATVYSKTAAPHRDWLSYYFKLKGVSTMNCPIDCRFPGRTSISVIAIISFGK